VDSWDTQIALIKLLLSSLMSGHCSFQHGHAYRQLGLEVKILPFCAIFDRRAAKLSEAVHHLEFHKL
jgi:hypothetical protein